MLAARWYSLDDDWFDILPRIIMSSIIEIFFRGGRWLVSSQNAIALEASSRNNRTAKRTLVFELWRDRPHPQFAVIEAIDDPGNVVSRNADIVE